MDVRLAACCLAVGIALSGCADRDPAPASAPTIPNIRVESFPVELRPEIEQRLAAARASRSEPQAIGELAMFLHAHQQWETARQLYRVAVSLEPSALRWNYYLGVVSADSGELESAAESLQVALTIDPGFRPAQRRLAGVLLDLNRAEEAARIYQTLLETDSNDAEARFGLGRALALQGRDAEAIEQLSEAVRLVPDYGAAHYELSLAYRDAGRPDQAQRHLDLFRQRKGAPLTSDALMAAVERLAQGAGDHVRRGVELEAKGDLSGAIQEHLLALEADPSLAQAHVNLVSLYARSGDVDSATRHYRAALDLNPAQASLHYDYGVLLFTQERYREAGEAFERALEANPAYAAAHNNLGQVLETEQRFDEAARHYRAALEAQPKFRLARFHLGRLLLAERRPQQAAEQFRLALEPRDEMTPQILFALAASLAQSGDRTAALDYGEQARSLARQMGQQDLAVQIEQDLAKLR